MPMGLGLRILVYLVLLTAGACLALGSVVAHFSLSGWLTRQGLIANPCGHGCAEGWAVTLVGAMLVMVATGIGLLARRGLPYGLLAPGLALAYAAALVWSVYGVQYALAALFFALPAYAAGRGAARAIAGG
jgi:hypothetical protein